MPAKMTHTIAGMARPYSSSRRSPEIAGILWLNLLSVISRNDM